MSEGSVLSKSARQKKLLELLMPQGSRNNQLFAHVTQAYVAESLGVTDTTIKADVKELKEKGYEIISDNRGMIIANPIHELNLKLTTTELVTLFEALCIADQFEQVTEKNDRPQLLHWDILRGIALKFLQALEPQKMVTKDKESGETFEIENNPYAEKRIKEVLGNSFAHINREYNIDGKRFFTDLRSFEHSLKNSDQQSKEAKVIDAVKGKKTLMINFDGKIVAAKAEFASGGGYELRTADKKAKIIGYCKLNELIAIVDKVEGSR